MLDTTYTKARANLARLCDEAAKNREIVRIHRRGGEDVSIIASDELENMIETLHLLRSPRNAERLFTALERALKREGEVSTVEEVRRETGLEE